MLEIELNPGLEQVLDFYANTDGVSKSALARKAIIECLEDREDYDLGVEALRDPGPHISLEDLIRKYGLEDSLSLNSETGSKEKNATQE